MDVVFPTIMTFNLAHPETGPGLGCECLFHAKPSRNRGTAPRCAYRLRGGGDQEFGGGQDLRHTVRVA